MSRLFLSLLFVLDIYIDVYYKFISKSTSTIHALTKPKELRMTNVSYTSFERIKRLIREAAEKAIQTVSGASGAEDAGKGVYIRVYHLPDIGNYIGLIELFAAWVGRSANDNKVDKYMIVSVEKAIRLARKSLSNGHTSSWESRDLMCAGFRDKFGGAILVRCVVKEIDPDPIRLLFTVSGLTEVGDEAVALLTAINLPWQVNMDDIKDIATTSRNSLVKKLDIE